MKQPFKILAPALFFAVFADAYSQNFNPGNALVAHYPLDGNALDLSLNQLHGNYLGSPISVQGQVNLALEFDGINDVIVVDHHECFNSIDSEMTISGWVKPFSIANGGTWLAFICKGNQLGLNTSPFSVLYLNAPLKPFLRYVDENGNLFKHEFNVNGGVSLNNWTFFTWTFNKGVTKVYKNGQLLDQTVLGMTKFLKNTEPFEIGRDFPGFPEKLDGVLDDICLFNRALTDAQVLDMYLNKHCFSPTPEIEFKTICDGDSYHGFSLPGTYFDTLQMQNGCHELKELILNVLPNSFEIVNAEICKGHSFEGFTETGIYSQKFQAANGCDSTRTINLKVNEAVLVESAVSICQSDSIEINGKFHHPPAIILDTIPSVSGCDTLMLFKLNALPYIPENQTVALCPKDLFEFKGEQFKAPAILFDTLFSENACDTVLTIELVQIPSPETSREIFLCKGEWVVVGGKVYDFETVVKDTLPSENACDTVRTTQIFIDQPLHPFLQNDTSVCSGEQAVLKSPYPETVWNGNFSGQNFVMTGPGLAIAAAVNENGCPLRDSVWVRTCCAEEGIFVPNVFSPDDNGKNDEFRAFASELCRQFTLSIYDRWGELIFFSEDPEKGWNGKFRGKPCPSDVYVWVLELNEGGSRKTEIKKGSVALIR